MCLLNGISIKREKNPKGQGSESLQVEEHLKMLGGWCAEKNGSTVLLTIPALCLFPIWLFPSCILYNKPVIVKCFLEFCEPSSQAQGRGCGNTQFQAVWSEVQLASGMWSQDSLIALNLYAVESAITPSSWCQRELVVVWRKNSHIWCQKCCEQK